MSRDIRQMFSRIARRYDLANTVLSLGMHYRWRKRAVTLAMAGSSDRVLDLACGTGDFAAAFSRATEGAVIATDFSVEMLMLAKMKENRRIIFELSDIQSLPHPDNSFDLCSIAFGIRNVDDPRAALLEMRRVIKPGGRIVVLEFGRPEGVRGFPYRLYSRLFIPFLGMLVTGDRKAYAYLTLSSSRFPSGLQFARMMKECGIQPVDRQILHAGLVHIYLGFKE